MRLRIRVEMTAERFLETYLHRAPQEKAPLEIILVGSTISGHFALLLFDRYDTLCRPVFP